MSKPPPMDALAPKTEAEKSSCEEDETVKALREGGPREDRDATDTVVGGKT